MVSETRDWLERLYGRSPGYWTLVAFDKGRPKAIKWYSTDQLDRAARTIAHYADRFDIYTSVGTWARPAEPTPERRMPRGDARDVISLAGFWADLDIGTEGHKPAKSGRPNSADEAEALSILDGLPEPSAVVHSGGGLQVWHFFDEPWVFDTDGNKLAAEASAGWHRRLVAAGEERGLHVDATGDLARILRIPGSQNHKLGTSRRVRLIETAGLAEAVRHAPGELSAVGLPNEPTSDHSWISSDDFPLTWPEILAPHGWTIVAVRHDGATLWARPGKSKGEGHSAVTDPYGVPVLVNFSESVGLPTGPGQRLTKLRVYALLNHGGDVRAAKRALARLVPESAEKLAEIAQRFVYARIDWQRLWAEEDTEPDWLAEPLIERGRQIAVYSEAKAGKSLLLFEISLALAEGAPVLGNEAREPITVLYIDQENMHRDLRDRGTAMGYAGHDFPRLHYYSFPDLSWLDTEEGGRELYALAKHHEADLVVIDTLARVVEGDENENDTYHNFYKYTGVKLKAAGITLVRLDHSGKDIAKGMRGASSKATDVDEVWQLAWDRETKVVTLTRTHSRSNHGNGQVVLCRRDEPRLHHAVLTDHQDADVWEEISNDDG